jgi:predicted dehydrogenase
MINIGIIGLGHIATHFIRAAKMIDTVNIAAAADINPAKRVKVDGESINFYSNYEEMLACEDDLHGVAVAIPPEFHFQILNELDGKLDFVLIEKPIVAKKDEFHLFLDRFSNYKTNIIFALHARFGKELIWFREKYENELIHQYGEITGFSSNFFDPYVLNGIPTPICANLVSSWLDSSVNALSVLNEVIDIESMEIKKLFRSKLDTLHVEDLVSKADCTFMTKESAIGWGNIYTNWTLGINHKVTDLITRDGVMFTINHSSQEVIIDENGNKKKLFQEKNGYDRLTNHYRGLLSDCCNHVQHKTNNADLAIKLHKLVFSLF